MEAGLWEFQQPARLEAGDRPGPGGSGLGPRLRPRHVLREAGWAEAVGQALGLNASPLQGAGAAPGARLVPQGPAAGADGHGPQAPEACSP